MLVAGGEGAAEQTDFLALVSSPVPSHPPVPLECAGPGAVGPSGACAHCGSTAPPDAEGCLWADGGNKGWVRGPHHCLVHAGRCSGRVPHSEGPWGFSGICHLNPRAEHVSGAAPRAGGRNIRADSRAE